MSRTTQYDWHNIRADYLGGKTMEQISNERGGLPTPGAISKRCKKENWLALAPGRKNGAVATKDNPLVREQILESLENGSTYAIAARLVGISPDTLTRWRKNDIEFAAACQRAKASLPAAAMATIKQAIDGGDVGTAKWAAERHELTRMDYRTPDKNAGDGGLNITINIPRTEQEAVAVNRMLEGELAETEPDQGSSS